jgi:hypothetical protein
MEHADKALPEVFIELFGERRNLSPSFGTFVRFEKATGKNALDQMVWLSPSAIDICTLVWAALGGEKSGKTVDEVADAMTPRHLEDVKSLVRAMFEKAEVPEELKKSDAA